MHRSNYIKQNWKVAILIGLFFKIIIYDIIIVWPPPVNVNLLVVLAPVADIQSIEYRRHVHRRYSQRCTAPEGSNGRPDSLGPSIKCGFSGTESGECLVQQSTKTRSTPL
jgi:hypothetical protein